MFCPKCGKTIADDSIFCQHCGATMDATATTSAPAAQPASAAPSATAATKSSRIVLIVLVIALAAFLGFAISRISFDKDDADTTEQTQAASDSTESSDIPEVKAPDVELPTIEPSSDGSLHSKIFKRSATNGSVRYTFTYTEGTYNDAPDDTILGIYITMEMDRSKSGVEEAAADFYSLVSRAQSLNNPNFSFRDNSSEFYYSFNLDFDQLASAESAELIPCAAALVGTTPSGNLLKMSQVESFLISNNYVLTHQD